MPESDYFDVCILGSGMAGSLTALILAKSGKRVALIDRTGHPRFSIGESSTPAADYLLESLSHHYQLEQLLPLCRFGSWRATYPQIRCGCKRGFSYVWHGKGDEYRATRRHDCELLVTASAATEVADTQWYRPDVDQYLYELAIEQGAVPFIPAELIDASWSSLECEKQWRLVVQTPSTPRAIGCDWVVDASGPNSYLMKLLDIADSTARLQTNTAAIFTHIEQCGLTENWLQRRQAHIQDFPFPIDQAAVHHLFRDGWMWQIGFVGALTSVGFVFNNQAALQSSTSESAEFNPARLWEQTLDSKPVLGQVIGSGSLAKFPGRVLGTDRVQHLRAAACGNGWAALPFTYGFIDPLHSTGIAHSLSGVTRLCAALLKIDKPARQDAVVCYAQQLEQELLHVDMLIAGCYLALKDFRLFNCWTMLYFAAATTYERLHRQNQVGCFLLADDKPFREIVEQAFMELVSLLDSSDLLSNSVVESYVGRVARLIEPYNHVGLFAPRLPNLYWHTAAEK